MFKTFVSLLSEHASCFG